MKSALYIPLHILKIRFDAYALYIVQYQKENQKLIGVVLMLKKTTVCLSVLLGICVLHVSAAATTSDHIVKINAFNKIYYGTISPDKNSGNSTFTALENSDGLSSIYGKWKKNSFSGNCDISYNNGHILSVEYNKKGLVYKYCYGLRLLRKFSDLLLFQRKTLW